MLFHYSANKSFLFFHLSFWDVKALLLVQHEWFVGVCVCVSGGRIIRVSGQHLDVVQEPRIRVTLTPLEPHSQKKKKKKKRRSAVHSLLRRERRIVPEHNCPEGSLCVSKQVQFTQVSLSYSSDTEILETILYFCSIYTTWALCKECVGAPFPLFMIHVIYHFWN